eukprot:gene8314-9886_t
MVSTCSIIVLFIAIGWAVLTKAQQSDHLVVLSHGLHGSRHDLTYLADHLEKAGCLVLRSSANEMLDSHVGVHAGGMKLADEVWNFLYLHSGVRRISFVGNSLVTKFTTEIDRLLGFHEGRYLIDKVAHWLVSP